MIVIYITLIISYGALVLVRYYPLALAAWLEALVDVVDQWLEDEAEAAERRLREKLARVEQRIRELDEERAVLRWLQLALLTFPFGEQSVPPDDRLSKPVLQAEPGKGNAALQGTFGNNTQ
jgi:DNA-binding transcriptional MerR regulator